eukprot:2851526-Amphidinium_carterae.1
MKRATIMRASELLEGGPKSYCGSLQTNIRKPLLALLWLALAKVCLSGGRFACRTGASVLALELSKRRESRLALLLNHLLRSAPATFQQQ